MPFSRVLTATLGALLLTGAVACAPPDRESAGAQTESGVNAAEATSAEDFGGKVLGKPIEVLQADHQNKADVAASKAREWFDTQGLDMLIGGTNSGANLAMAKDIGPDEALKLRDAGTIQSFEKLNEAALAKHPGATIEESELEEEYGRYVYQLELRDDKGVQWDLELDAKTGDLTMTRYRHVVEEVENHFTQLTLADARAIKLDARIGDFLTDSLPPMDFGRIAATNAISDVYAMGGRPIMALALVAMPVNQLPVEVIAELLGVPQAVANLFSTIARQNITLLMVSQSSSMSNVSLALPDADAARALLAPLHLSVVPFDESAAHTTGALRSAMRGQGLSLGDRACLALCAIRGATALTTDKAWGKVSDVSGLAVELLR